MAERSSIEWTQSTWNPVAGCRKVSPGCDSCYAIRDARRMAGNPHPRVRETYSGLTMIQNGRPNWTGVIRCLPERLLTPLAWRTPRRVFVNSQSDLFHEDVPFEFIAAVFGIMARAERHTFQVLTKRPARALEFFAWLGESDVAPRLECAAMALREESMNRPEGDSGPLHCKYGPSPEGPWPLPNVWLGTSVEDQRRADERIPDLLATPAAVRFLSAEPLLGPVNLQRWLPIYGHRGGPCCIERDGWHRRGESLDRPVTSDLHWVITGGESGPGARPCNLAWIRSIVEQCAAAGVPCFVKQLGARPYYLEDDGQGGSDVEGVEHAATAGLYSPDRKGGLMEYWPEDLRVRQFPEVRGDA